MPGGLTLTVLRESLRNAEPAALLVEPRVLRRVIRLDRRLAGLGFFVPHRKCYTIDRGRLLAFVDRSELDVPPSDDLPRRVILLAKPADDDALDHVGPREALVYYERLLFHARVHLELDRRVAEQQQPSELAAKRRLQIGESEFAEIRAVLLKDGYLFPHPSDLDTYVEFVAVYLELRYFSPDELTTWFPGVRDWRQIEHIVSQDIYHHQLFEAGRLVPTDMETAPVVNGEATPPNSTARTAAPRALSAVRVRRLLRKADRASELGNSVHAAIERTRATAAAPKVEHGIQIANAIRELHHLADRLQPVLKLSDAETAQWREALEELLQPAADGLWSNEARLLYDLQKVCVERERGIYKLDLIQWCRSLGKVPMRRPLPLLREVLIVKHLRTAHRRLSGAQMTPAGKVKLSGLLTASLSQVEHGLRERLRPLVVEVFDEVGLIPQNVPERVARRKLVEELLDRVVEQGFFNMGNLRDALSRNDLKLPDLSGPVELLRGDRLLKADHRLSQVLDGVYRRGTVYLRWPQRLSSLAFGTRYGRYVTQYAAIPFGGAYLGLEFLKHVAGWFTPAPHLELPPGMVAHHPLPMEQMDTGNGWPFYTAVFCVGVWLLMLMHWPQFRKLCGRVLKHAWRGMRRVVVELPKEVVESPIVQRALSSATYAAIRSYVIRPGVVTLLLAVPAWLMGHTWSWSVTLNIFLLSALFLNSPIGRYADEWLSDFLGRAWYDLRMRVFAALYQWIMDVFHQLLVVLERVVYTVDEFLRFRSGDSAMSRGVKLVTGACWFLVSYVILFVFTLLVEPQINPIKHFPVVTVSHKLILPTGPFWVDQLAPYFGKAWANTIVWSTIWLIPGVFGFLVWELKENWRLYAANRRQQLAPIHIGHHGETMVGLLRPGFHSGTLPKKFALLRKAVRQSRRTHSPLRVSRRRDELHHAETAVRNFVERELIGLCEEGQLLPRPVLSVGEVRLATNRVEVELLSSELPNEPALLTWEETGGQLTAAVDPPGWLETLNDVQRESLTTALGGLLQRAGTDQVRGPVSTTVQPPFSWAFWVANWTTPPATVALRGPHTAPLSPTSRAG